MDDLLNRAPCGFLTFTDDGKIVLANTTLSGMLGMEAELLGGRSVETILTLPSRIFYQTHLFPLLRIEGEVSEVYLTLRSAAGDLPVLVNAVRQERDGMVVNDCILVAMRQRGEYENAILDAKRTAEKANREREAAIDELEQAQVLLEAKRTELEELNARLRRMMTETHHRVKNNLQVICALIEMQLDERECVPASEFVRLVTNIRALSAIHDLLTQEVKAGNDQDTLSSRVVLEKLVALLSQTAGARQIVAEVEDAALDTRQATGLALITSEIMSNAMKHSPGAIRLSLRVDGGAARLEIQDEGPGFPPDFDPITAANTGLALIENVGRWDLRGTVAYTNRPEGGAAVVVTFPLHDPLALVANRRE